MKTLFSIFLLPVTVMAQVVTNPNLAAPAKRAFDKDKHYFTASIGVPNLNRELLAAQVRAWRAESLLDVKGFGPVFARYEYGVGDNIGFGAVFGYSSAGIEGSYTYSETRYDPSVGGVVSNTYTDRATLDLTSISLGLRVNFHFGKRERFDHFFGFAVGYSSNVAKVNFVSTNPAATSGSVSFTSPVPIYVGVTYGMRYYFTEGFGITGDIGLDKWAVLQVGIVGKF